MFDRSHPASHVTVEYRLSEGDFSEQEVGTLVFTDMPFQDHDRRIREATQQAFEQLVLKVRRSLAPILKSLMGHWILSQCDTHTPAASAACQAFQAAFSPGKQPEAIGFCKDDILNVSSSSGPRGRGDFLYFCIHSNRFDHSNYVAGASRCFVEGNGRHAERSAVSRTHDSLRVRVPLTVHNNRDALGRILSLSHWFPLVL